MKFVQPISTSPKKAITKYLNSRDSCKIKELERQVEKHMAERNVMEILSNIEHLLNYTKYFVPLSGTESK